MVKANRSVILRTSWRIAWAREGEGVQGLGTGGGGGIRGGQEGRLRVAGLDLVGLTVGGTVRVRWLRIPMTRDTLRIIRACTLGRRGGGPEFRRDCGLNQVPVPVVR